MAVSKYNHVFIAESPTSLSFTSGKSKGKELRFPIRNRVLQGEALRHKLDSIWKAETTEKERRTAIALPVRSGMYLEFLSAPDFDLQVKSLEDLKAGIHLLNQRVIMDCNNNAVTMATVYIPFGKEKHFIKKVEEYLANNTKNGNPKNQKLIDSIEEIKQAVLVEAFWTGRSSEIPKNTPVWCEVWLRVDADTSSLDHIKVETVFFSLCDQLNIVYKKSSIRFPERSVCLIYADNKILLELIARSDNLAEIKRTPETAEFFIRQHISEQQKWVEDLLKRVVFEHTDTTICILDTGVNSEHPLLNQILHESDLHSIDRTWGTDDSQGHGTAIAGIATYFDLVDCLLSDKAIHIGHEIESIKILPPPSKAATKEELFGAVTEQAVYQAEIERPKANRIICMAITADKYNTENGSPTSWSAALDNLISGAADRNRRLFFVSAGNVNPTEFSEVGYPDANILHSVESPGQSWNAITVGAYSKDITLENPDLAGYSIVAGSLGLSPFSSTSIKWDKKWPNKPDILCDGGNLAKSGNFYTQSDELSLLTTESAFHTHLFTTIHGTSSAVAQASWIAAQIREKYPAFWPETVRALMIDSAEWSPDMLQKFCKSDKKMDKRTLLRTCGYGIPNYETALWSLNNSVSMIIQGELQPFAKEKERYKTKEMHIHNLPWPKEVLKDLGSTQVTMRVTLSYYIEPGPGEIGWKDRYRYASCGLRFDVNNTNETVEDFKKRINVAVRDDEKDSGDGDSGSSRWFLGKKLRDVGSLHSDFWIGNAVDLCECNYIGIYPTIGWWRERAYLGRYNSKVRYALVVSLRTPPQTVDLYTPIVTEIKNRISVPIDIAIKNNH